MSQSERIAESMVPVEDDNWIHESAYAQTAAAAVVYAIRIIRTADPHNAVWAARQLIEAADYAEQISVGGYPAVGAGTPGEGPIVEAQMTDIDSVLHTLEISESVTPSEVRAEAIGAGLRFAAKAK